MGSFWCKFLAIFIETTTQFFYFLHHSWPTQAKAILRRSSKNKELFTTWCSVTGRQRINAKGFYAIWFIFLKEGKNNEQNQNACNHVYKNSTPSNDCSPVQADPPPSRPIWLFLYILLHVVPAFAGHWLLVFSPFWWSRPAFTQGLYIERLCKLIWKTTFDYNSSFLGAHTEREKN